MHQELLAVPAAAGRCCPPRRLPGAGFVPAERGRPRTPGESAGVLLGCGGLRLPRVKAQSPDAWGDKN